MEDIRLTKHKAKWVKGRDITLRGRALYYNASQQAKYRIKLEGFTQLMIKTVNKEVEKLFHREISTEYFAMDASLSSQARILINALTKRFTQLFNLKARPIAENMVTGAMNVSKSTLHGSLKQLTGGISLKTGVVPPDLQEVATATIAENVSLIKSIPQQYFKDITGSVMRSITTGRGLADLVPDLTKYAGQTRRRVKNLALDQTRKAYNSINKQRMIAIGVKTFEWNHSGGGREPRESHVKISGKIFSFDNLEQEQAALGVPLADRGIPGQPINCKCTMVPVVEFDSE